MGGRTFWRWSPWLSLAGCLVFASCTSLPMRHGERAYRDYDDGMEQFNSGNYAGAVQSFLDAEAAVPAGEFHSDISFQLGRCYLALGDYEAARFHFSAAKDETARPIRWFDAWKGLGDSHYFAGNDREAVEAYRECLRLEEDAALLEEIYYKLAVAVLNLGDRRQAVAYFDRVTRYVPGPFDPVFDPDRAPRTVDAVEAPLRAILPLPDFATRDEWGARASRSNFDRMTPIFRATVHHSAMESDARARSRVASEIRGIQRNHQRSSADGGRDWADIAYHYIIDRGGRVWEGRPIGMQGAHAGNPDLNRGNVGIVLLGNFNVQEVSLEQSQSLEVLLRLLMERYGFTPDRVFAHRDLRETECPGANLVRSLDGIREALSAEPTRASSLHRVSPGETLFGIARRYGLKVSDLERANGEIRGPILRAGEEILIPAH